MSALIDVTWCSGSTATLVDPGLAFHRYPSFFLQDFRNSLEQKAAFLLPCVIFCYPSTRPCSQPPDKPKLVGYAMKLDLVSFARLAGLRAVRFKIVGTQVT